MDLTRTHLAVIVNRLDWLEAAMQRLTLQQKIDLGARIRAIKARAEAIDEMVKADINKKLHGKDGVVRGILFSALRASHAVTRVDQQYLEINHPRVYRKCLKTTNEARILFQAR